MALGVLSALTAGLPTASLDWQPALITAQPWRVWTAAFVHWSPQHLLAGVAGCVTLAAFGAAARLPPHAALAWLLAWPLGHLGLFVQPSLLHYGGLSGVLHAGVAVAALSVACDERGALRALGVAVGAGLLIKLAFEAPFETAPAHGWSIALAPLAHATGALAGALTWSAIRLAARRR